MEALKNFLNAQTPVHPEAWEHIKSKFTELEFKEGASIFEAGDRTPYKLFIAQGITRSFYLKDGKEITVDFHFKNSFATSYTSWYTGEPSRSYMSALEHVVCYRISHESMNGLYDDHKLGERLGRIITEKNFQQKIFREATLLLDSPKERFIWLQEHHSDWIQRIPQQYLASYIGISPETFSRYKADTLRQQVASN